MNFEYFLGSDETTLNCITTECPRYAFRCVYGACVSGSAECNRRVDCADGSDEATEKCPAKDEQQLQGSCGLAHFQCDNGKYFVLIKQNYHFM